MELEGTLLFSVKNVRKKGGKEVVNHDKVCSLRFPGQKQCTFP